MSFFNILNGLHNSLAKNFGNQCHNYQTLKQEKTEIPIKVVIYKVHNMNSILNHMAITVTKTF